MLHVNILYKLLILKNFILHHISRNKIDMAKLRVLDDEDHEFATMSNDTTFLVIENELLVTVT